jgi:hypothetical protein
MPEISRFHGIIIAMFYIDIAPETLYSKATGSPFPEWVENDEPSANPSFQGTG